MHDAWEHAYRSETMGIGGELTMEESWGGGDDAGMAWRLGEARGMARRWAAAPHGLRRAGGLRSSAWRGVFVVGDGSGRTWLDDGNGRSSDVRWLFSVGCGMKATSLVIHEIAAISCTPTRMVRHLQRRTRRTRRRHDACELQEKQGDG
jgi:hypothetical protein